jgi:hypothetical protein
MTDQDFNTRLREYLPKVFKGNKRLTASEFWRRIEESIGGLEKLEVDGEVYRGISRLYQENFLGLDGGCYYIKEDKRDETFDEKRR